MEKAIRHTVKNINLTYYTIYLIAIVAVTIIFVMQFVNINYPAISIPENSDLGRTISSIYLIYLLGSIPFSLYGFTKRAKKWQQISDDTAMFNAYTKGAKTRIWIIGIALVVGIVLVKILNSKSMVFSAAIAAIALYFCKPTPRKIIKELSLEERENEK